MGLVYVAAPGPVNTETVRRGLSGGFRVALALQVGALVGELVYAVMALFGLSVLVMQPVLHMLLGMIGTGVLVYLGWSAVRDGWHRSTPALPLQGRAGSSRARCRPDMAGSFAIGAVISLANPFAVVFWLSMGGAVLNEAHRDGAIFLGGFFLSLLFWAFVLPFLVGAGRSAFGRRIFDQVSVACGVLLIAFGLVLGHAVVTS